MSDCKIFKYFFYVKMETSLRKKCVHSTDISKSMVHSTANSDFLTNEQKNPGLFHISLSIDRALEINHKIFLVHFRIKHFFEVWGIYYASPVMLIVWDGEFHPSPNPISSATSRGIWKQGLIFIWQWLFICL